MLPLSILKAPTRRAALAAMLLMGAIVAGYVYYVSLYLQRVKDFTPVATGLALVLADWRAARRQAVPDAGARAMLVAAPTSTRTRGVR
jgi:hypothetical protein